MERVASGRRQIGSYEVGRNLGQGRFSKVKFARHVDTGSPVAIKIIRKDPQGTVDKLIIQEISAMKLIKHPHVVSLFEVLASKQNVYLILEYVNGGELLDKIIENGGLNEGDARKYFWQLIHGVDYCHSRGVYHRDLKPENLLLDDDNNLKIADFGLSALSQQRRNDGLFHTICGSPDYVAPEVMNEKGYNGAPADLWSCGVILYVILTGTLPFSDSSLSHLHRKVHVPELDFPSNFPTDAKELIKRLLDPNPLTRLTIQGIRESAWFLAGGSLYNLDMYVSNSQDFDQCDDTEMCFRNGHGDAKSMQEVCIQDSTPVLINAFEIISLLSPGLDLSGLFVEKENMCKKDIKFTSRHPAREILSKLKDFAWRLGYQVWCKDFKIKLRNSKPGRKGFLCIATQIMEVGPAFFLIDMHKTSGDTLEYHDFQRDLCMGLKDIVRKLEHCPQHP
ncbi:hypothetical protein GOP47_0024461 [Adiantum capillus-veneris]|uniref:non-specific serine/threonine protein kinase n=1 Tax=Adiantum capillus-veneris TaxID=13818 RepID=A0A9D4Z526_ADICA|nr:hypothetical protein GOP47_0024461 [Adiantum capillus-veneris]